MSRPGCRGQASVEALALIPLLVAAIVLAWQLAALVRGAVVSHELVRERALAARGGGDVEVTAPVRVPSLIPGTGRLAIDARAVVRTP